MEHFMGGVTVPGSMGQFFHHELSKTGPSTNRRTKSQRCAGVAQCVPGMMGIVIPALPIHSESRGPRPTRRPVTGSRARRECGCDMLRRTGDVVTEIVLPIMEHEQVKPEKDASAQIMGDGFVRAIVAKVLEDSDAECEFEGNDDEDWENMCTHALLMPHLDEVLLSTQTDQTEIEQVLEDDTAGSITSCHEEVFSSKFVGDVLEYAVEEFADESAQKIVFEEEEILFFVESCFNDNTPMAALHVAEPEVKLADNVVSVGSLSILEDELNEEQLYNVVRKGRDNLDSCQWDRRVFGGDGGNDFENWDDDGGLSVATFASEWEVKIDDEVAEWMAGNLVSGLSLLEISVQAELVNVHDGNDIPCMATSHLGSCVRRRFPRCLKPSENGPIVPQEVYPMDCFPPSKSVASVDIEHCFSVFVTEPYQFEVAAFVASKLIQRRWRMHMKKADTQAGSNIPETVIPSGARNGVSQVLDVSCCLTVPSVMQPRHNSNPAAVVKQQDSLEQSEKLEVPSSGSTDAAQTKLNAPPLTSARRVVPCVVGGSSTITADLHGGMMFTAPPTPRLRRSTTRRTVAIPEKTITESTPAPMPLPRPVPQGLRRRPRVDKKSVESEMTAQPMMPDVVNPTSVAAASKHRPPSEKRNFAGCVRTAPCFGLERSSIAIVPKSDAAEISQAVVAHRKHGRIPRPPTGEVGEKMEQSTPTTPRRFVEFSRKVAKEHLTCSSTPRRPGESRQSLSDPSVTSVTAAVAHWPPCGSEPAVVMLRPGKVSAVQVSDMCRQPQTTLYRMEKDDDVSDSLLQVVRASSHTQGLQTLGVDVFDLDGDVDSKPRRPKPQKLSQHAIVQSSEMQSDTSLSPSRPASSGQAPGTSLPPGSDSLKEAYAVQSGQTAMELDLGFGNALDSRRAPNFRADPNGGSFNPMSMLHVGQNVPRKALPKPSLLPLLAAPGKTAESIAWSVKMAHGSSSRGGRRSVF